MDSKQTLNLAREKIKKYASDWSLSLLKPSISHASNYISLTQDESNQPFVVVLICLGKHLKS